MHTEHSGPAERRAADGDFPGDTGVVNDESARAIRHRQTERARTERRAEFRYADGDVIRLRIRRVNEGQDVGLVGQFRLGRSLLIDGEIAKNTLASGDRVDRRLMAGLTYELAANRRLSPYIAGGLGVTQVDVGGGSYQDSQSLAELGGGLRWRMTDRLSLFGDLRFGARHSIDSTAATDPRPMDTGLAKVMPQSDEKYSRMRLGAMLTF